MVSMNSTVQRQLYVLVLCALFGVIFMVYQNHQSTKPIRQDQKLFSQARQYPGRPLPKTEAAATDPEQPADCAGFYEKVETLPMESLVFDLREGRLTLPAPAGCKQDPLTAKLFIALQTSCAPAQIAQSTQACETALFQYRARRIQLWSEGQSLKELSTDILVQRFFGLLASGAVFEPGGADEVRKLSQELQLRMPTSSSPLRIAVVSYIVDSDLTPEEAESFETILREARSQAPEDWQLFEIELIRKAGAQPEAYARSVQEFLTSNPHSPIGLYHGGCVAWNSGRREEAQQYFHKAREGAPLDSRFAEAALKSQAADLGTSICTATLSFNSADF